MIIPLHDNVLIEVTKVERKTAGGIILSDEYAEREEMASTDAIIVALGETAFPHMEIKPVIGDKVCINKYAGRLYEIEGRSVRLVAWEEIQGILQ